MWSRLLNKSIKNYPSQSSSIATNSTRTIDMTAKENNKMTMPKIYHNDLVYLDEFYSFEEKENQMKKNKLFSEKYSQNIRNQWVEEEIISQRKLCTSSHKFNIFITSWNLNGKKPPDNLERWLRAEKNVIPDFYVIGLQEIIDLTVSTLVIEKPTKERSQIWIEKITSALQNIFPRCSYSLLLEQHLVGMMLCIFVLNKNLHTIPPDSVKYCLVPLGVLRLGNKGAIAIRFRIFDTSICFVSSHLSAHNTQVENRNNEFHSILRKATFFNNFQDNSDNIQKKKKNIIKFNGEAYQFKNYFQKMYRKNFNQVVINGLHYSETLKDDPFLKKKMNYSSLIMEPSSTSTYGIIEHDIIFWLGDLNYRINTRNDVESIYEQIDNVNIYQLLKNDQLLYEKSENKVFVGFEESQINFLPTYKFVPNTNEYFRNDNKKIRTPAWCDRILWRATVKSDVVNNFYTSCIPMCTSDHKPVIASFNINVHQNISERYSAISEKMYQYLNDTKDLESPQIKIEPSSIVFEDSLVYMESRKKVIHLKNVGNTKLTWHFMPKIDDMTICKYWLSVHPDFGFLIPGTSVEIIVHAIIDTSTIYKLKTGAEFLTDTLFLRVDKGSDYFIHINAKLSPSCFGNNLLSLVKNHNIGFQNKQNESLIIQNMPDNTLKDFNSALKIPKELWYLCDFLWKYDFLKIPGLFVDSQCAIEVKDLAYIRRSLNEGTEIVSQKKPETDSSCGSNYTLRIFRRITRTRGTFQHFSKDSNFKYKRGYLYSIFS